MSPARALALQPEQFMSLSSMESPFDCPGGPWHTGRDGCGLRASAHGKDGAVPHVDGHAAQARRNPSAPLLQLSQSTVLLARSGCEHFAAQKKHAQACTPATLTARKVALF